VILAHPGADLAAWHTWAERRFGKSREAFMESDWQAYLEHVTRLAREKEEEAAQEPRGATTASQDVSGAAPGDAGLPGAPSAPDTPTEAVGPSWRTDGPDLFTLEEEQDASEYGEN
jgi:hypothetical protein